MKKKAFVLFVPLFFAAVFSGFSDTLENLAGPERAVILREGQIISEVQLKKPRPLLMPDHEAVRAIVGEIQRSLNPGIFVETLSLYKKPGGLSWTAEERRDLYNEALSISSLAGIQYFSATRNTMRIFYETSTVINSPTIKRPLPDPVFAEPENLVLYARQKDLTFGDNVYRYEYRAGNDSLIFTQENITAMSVGIITAVGKNRLRTVVAIIDTEDSLLIYVASMAKASTLPGMGERIGNSFTNRTTAILKWFTGKADKVFLK